MTLARNVTAAHTGNHLPAVDGVRGLAVLMVMIHHNCVMLIQNSAQLAAFHLLSAGWIGVELFFVLSGYLITGILLDTRGEKHYFRNFYARRVLRIFPLFYLLMIFSFVILPHLPLPPVKAERFDSVGNDQWMYWTFLVNVAIAKANMYRHGIMDVAWSLSIEEQFYLLWPLVALALPRRRLMMLCIALVVASPLLRLVAWEAGMTGKQIYVLTPFRLDGLAAGGLLACLSRSARPDRWVTPGIGGLLVGVGLALFIAGVAIEGGDPESELRATSLLGYSGATLASLGTLVAALSLPRAHLVIRFFSARFMRTFGKYSYCLYLVHLPLRAYLRDRVIKPEEFGDFPGGVAVGQALFYLASISLAFMVAWISWRLVEQPALSFKRYFPNIGATAMQPGDRIPGDPERLS